MYCTVLSRHMNEDSLHAPGISCLKIIIESQISKIQEWAPRLFDPVQQLHRASFCLPTI